MRTPKFWYRPAGLIAHLLTPLGWLYAAGTALRLRRGQRASYPVPVICVGNITAGGTGKTPLVMHLAQRLLEMGHSPQIVSRGYGGRVEGPVRVDLQTHRAEDVGDEPLLLSGFAPVWVAKDRQEGVMRAIEAGASVVLLDDGFQDGNIAPELSIIVVDARRGFGNGKCIPAGPLREPVRVGLSRGDLMVLMGEGGVAIETDLPILRGHLDPLPTGMPIRGARVLAFAGIGHPERFFAMLRREGADILREVALGDHQPLTSALMARLESDARASGALMVTTEKDAVRLPTSFRQKVVSVPVRLRLEDPAPLDAALDRIFKSAP